VGRRFERDAIWQAQVTMRQVDPSPLAAHAATPAELRERIEAERDGTPFLVLRDGDGAQRLFVLEPQRTRVSIGRSAGNDVALPWDTEVSRLHAELERLGDEWTATDDGLSRNGSFVNSQRISGRHRLRDGDVLRIGRTQIAYRMPESAVDAVKAHLRTLFRFFGVEHLPQNQKRSYLAMRALQDGVVSRRDL